MSTYFFEVFASLISIISALIAYIAYTNAAKIADLSNAHLEFHKTGEYSFFRTPQKKESIYAGSVCLAFVYVSVSNYSNLPITFREFELTVPGYTNCFYDSSTTLLEEYLIKDSAHQSLENNVRTIMWGNEFKVSLLKEHFISLPYTLSPYGYTEGRLLFSFAPLFNEKHLNALVIAKTTRGDFKFNIELKATSEISFKI